MQVPCHFFRQWKEPCIESLDLVDRCSGILGEVEDVHLALAVDDPHADRSVAQRVEGVLFARGFIDLDLAHLQDLAKLTLDDIRYCGSVLILRKEDEVIGCRVGIPFLDSQIDRNCRFHRVRGPISGLPVSDGDDQAFRIIGKSDVAVPNRV